MIDVMNDYDWCVQVQDEKRGSLWEVNNWDRNFYFYSFYNFL